MKNNHKISVIIVTKDRYKKLISLLDALLKSTEKNFELIIVDQSQSVSSHHKKIFKKKLAQFSSHIYIHQHKRGKSKGLNLAIKNSSAPILAFTDDDCLPRPNWIANILQSFEDKPTVTAVFGKTLPYQPQQHPHQTCPSIFTKPNSQIIDQPCKHWEEIGFGNNMAWKKKFFEEYGLFKEWLGPGSIGSNAEDAEISLRALTHQKTIFYNPRIINYHDKWLNKYQVTKQERSYKCGGISCYGTFAILGQEFAKKIIQQELKFVMYKIKEEPKNFFEYLNPTIMGLAVALLFFLKKDKLITQQQNLFQ